MAFCFLSVDQSDRLWIRICFYGISLSDKFGHRFFTYIVSRYPYVERGRPGGSKKKCIMPAPAAFAGGLFIDLVG